MCQPWQEPALSQGEENLRDLVQQGGKGRDEVDEDCGSGCEYVPDSEDEDVKMDMVCVLSQAMNVLKVFSVMKVKMTQKYPVPYCRKQVVHISRHLKQVHHWSLSQSRAAVTNFKLRKQYTFKSQDSAKAA